MEVSQFMKHFLHDLFKACGCLMILISILLAINSVEAVEVSLLWKIILLSSAYTLFKFAYVNNLEFGKKAQLTVFTICSTLADIMLILCLCLFNPNIDNNMILMYIIVILIIKGVVFGMMYIDDQKQAKQINAKLNEYKKATSD